MTDRAVRAGFIGVGMVPAALLVVLFVHLGAESWPLARDLSLVRLTGALLRAEWSPAQAQYGILYPFLGTLLTGAVALPLALAMSVSCALVVHYFLPPAGSTVARQALTILAGIPSVLYGLWGLTFVAPLLATARPPGLGLAATGFVVAVMVTPTMALAVESGFFVADENLGRAAAAMGLGRATTAFCVILPACKGALVGGAMLGLARAVGETMVVLMLAGNVVNLPLGPLEPYRTLSSHIALEVPFAMGGHRAALYAAAIVLAMTVIVIVRVLAPRRGSLA